VAPGKGHGRRRQPRPGHHRAGPPLPWDRNQQHYGITHQIPLLAGGALHEGRLIAELAQRASEDVARYSRDEVRYNVRAAYRNALAATHALAALIAYEQALEQDARDADLKVKVGAWASVDAAKVHFALASARAQRQAVQAQIDSLHALLAAPMGEALPGDAGRTGGSGLAKREEVRSWYDGGDFQESSGTMRLLGRRNPCQALLSRG